MSGIDVSQQGEIRTLRLARPEKKNALTDAMMREIGTALRDADADAGVRAVVIEAEGPDFCAGNDLGLIQDMASGRIAMDDLSSDHFLDGLSQFEKPLLCGVRGRAIGVGATMLLHCDLVCVAHDATLHFPFVNLSLVPEAASTYLLPARVGYARAYALLCLADRISGREAAAAGLVTVSVESNALSETVRSMANRLAAISPTALRETKRLMKDSEKIAAALARDKRAFIEQIDLMKAERAGPA